MEPTMLAERVFYHAETQLLGSKDKVSETLAYHYNT